MTMRYSHVKLPDGYAETQLDEDVRKATPFILAEERCDGSKAMEEALKPDVMAAFERVAAYYERKGE